IESDSPHAEIGEFAPQDATTNPSLVYAAVTKPGSAYAQLVEDAVRYAVDSNRDLDLDARAELACDYLVRAF
ncbi:hypothetical protein C0993_006991, partial [Termitomyces sp. T159_Od127]